MHRLFFAFAIGGLVFLWIADANKDWKPGHFFFLATAIIFAGHFVKWVTDLRAKKDKRTDCDHVEVQ